MVDAISIIQPAQWGEDHAAALLRLEGRSVDYKSDLSCALDSLRCHPTRHADRIGLYTRRMMEPPGEPWPYGTRLADGSRLAWHDDWDCFDDFCHAQLIRWLAPSWKPSDTRTPYELTHAGWAAAGMLRQLRAEGVTTADVRWAGTPPLPRKKDR